MAFQLIHNAVSTIDTRAESAHSPKSRPTASAHIAVNADMPAAYAA